MDIRIGNDIRLNVAISDFEILPEESIKCAHCFLTCEVKDHLTNVDPKSIVSQSKYTLYHNGSRIYNVLPNTSQVRPYCGPGVFGKSVSRYGMPIFTKITQQDDSENPVLICGYFQEPEQKITGDYYLVVMLVVENSKYGIHGKRHIVIDYGYVFTLAEDGYTCPSGGINIYQVKDRLPNTITWTIDPSDMTYKIGDTVEFSAYALDGDITFNCSSPTTFTGEGMAITATSVDNGRYIGVTETKVLHKKQKTNNSIVWDVNPSSGTHYIGDTVNFSAHTADGATFVFRDANNNIIPTTKSGDVYSGSIAIISSNTVIKALASETEAHFETSDTKTITATERPLPNLYAFSKSDQAPVPQTILDLNTPNELYTRIGQFTNGLIIDCSEGSSSQNHRFKMCWFAIPKAKTLRIEDANSHDDWTVDFTFVTIGNYKVYYKTNNVSSWSQVSLGLIIS